ncbi:hypothetical protein NGRA_3011 [Nosema granulosis]|uniref:Uncharacterized protein n=1 Tax=Nosema granulosis TaxID=83296 RepID=A0A9P6KXM2_9MICR|nr:hypothetical protein NGRA_3011 [Nosema granulosis]
MENKQRQNSNEGFWSELDESDEDFETMIGMSNKKKETEEVYNTEATVEPELKIIDKRSEEPTEPNLTEEINSEIVEVEQVKMKEQPVKNLAINKNEDSLESLKESTSFEFLTKEKQEAVEENGSAEKVSEDNKQSTDGVLPTECMDFLWDDEDEEVFIPMNAEKQCAATTSMFIPEEESDTTANIFVAEKISVDKDFISEEKEQSNTSEKMFYDAIESKKSPKSEAIIECKQDEVECKQDEVEYKQDEVEYKQDEDEYKQDEVEYKQDEVEYKQDEIEYKQDEVEYKQDEIEYKQDEVEYKQDEVEYKQEIMHTQRNKSAILAPTTAKSSFRDVPFSKGLAHSTRNQETKEKQPVSKKIDFNSQKPIAFTLSRFILSYSTFKQKRRNQQGEYIDKETNVYAFYEFQLCPKIPPSISLENISQLEYENIVKILSLKDYHVDSICAVLKVKDVVYSNKQYVEANDYPDINTVIDLCLVDKKMAVDYACKKNMWAFALLISNNSPDVVRRFFENTIDQKMASLALGVFGKEGPEDLVFDSDWKKYLKHILRLPFGDIHLKFIGKLSTEDSDSLYTFLVCLHILNIANIGDFSELYAKNFYMLQIAMFLDKHVCSVKGIDVLMYQYITVLYEWDKKAAEEFYKENKKAFKNDLQRSLDEVFNVAGGWGLRDVINFGISKILNVEEEKKPTSTDVRSSTLPCLNRVKLSSIKPITKETNTQKVNKPIGFKKMPVSQKQAVSNLEDSIEKNTVEPEKNNLEDLIEKNTVEPEKNTVDSKSLYSDQQHAKSFADILDLEKPHKEITTEDDTSLFLSKYNIDDTETGLKKKKEVKDEEKQESSFFSMFNIFKKNVYKVDLQASDDIKYDPVTKKWVSGSTPSVPQEVKKAVPKSIPLPSKVAKPNIDLKNMPKYANKKPTGKVAIPGVGTKKKPTEKDNEL